MINIKNRLFLTLCTYFCLSFTCAQNTCKIWKDFVEKQSKGGQSLLLDFSYAGYQHGEIGFPKVKYKIFNVCEFGAIPDDILSDREAVIKAISAAEANGSGVIFFPKGRYYLHKNGESSSSIVIKKSNIIFRGEGSGAFGSEIFMEEPNMAVNPEEKWTSPSLLSFSGISSYHKLTEITKDALKGSFRVVVKDAHNLKAGDWVCLRLNNNNQKVIEEEVAPYKIENNWSSLLIDGVQVYDYHQIASIKNKTIVFKEPLMKQLKADEGWYIQTYPKIEEIGVEDLAFIGNWKEKFIHHKDWIHDGGWKFIEFKNVVNSWVTRCRFTDVSEAVTVVSSANVSVTDCVVTGNQGHDCVHAQGSSRSFFGAIVDEPSQWHSVGVAKHSMGTVLWRIVTNSNSCFESHASQPRATLIDACEGGFMRGRAGGAIQNNPNHLSDLVLWNYYEKDKPTKDFDFWAKDTPYWRFLPPIIVGFHGQGTTFLQSQVLYEESNGKIVDPESLYEAQLKYRLGRLPQWVIDLKKIVKNKTYAGKITNRTSSIVNSVKELEDRALDVQAGDTILINDGKYNDIKLIVHSSGSYALPIVFRALHPGKVCFCGDAKVELRGPHIELSGITFKEGARNPKEWRSHGPGLVAVYDDYCTIANCLFQNFDKATSAYITTFINEKGKFPRFCHIHHCAFIGKKTFDQVINLNNTNAKELDGSPGIAMYHRINNCYFSNPPKIGNAGAAIRIGYWRKDYGRCLVDNNLFERQDSEAEIITSKSMENVFYNNTFLNCRGTLNFRHGDKQVALNNFFIGTDTLYEYGGMFVWGSDHIIGANYFSLPHTINERGKAAVYFNIGPKASEHALAYNCLVINNDFINNDNIFNFTPLYERRITAFGKEKVEFPHDIRIICNKFFTESFNSTIWHRNDTIAGRQIWDDNIYNGYDNSYSKISGIELNESANLNYDDSKIYIENINRGMDVISLKKILPYNRIDGIDLDFMEIIKKGVSGSPLNRDQVGPSWIKLSSWNN